MSTAASAPPADEKSLQAWFGKLKGKYRQVFDCMMPDGGMPLAWTRVFLMTNKAVGVADNDCSAVIVLRHESSCRHCMAWLGTVFPCVLWLHRMSMTG